MNPLTRDEIKTHVEHTHGIALARERTHATEYNGGDYPFYLKKNNRYPVVVHPDLVSRLRPDPISGVEIAEEPYHNSNLTAFPKLIAGKSACGYDISFANVEALDTFLMRIGAIAADSPETFTALDDIEKAASTLDGLSTTERETLILARLGQGIFRDRLSSAWACKCSVTGTDVPALLRASHIKPWRLCNNSERLDPENGLLLVANLDAAFDAGLISFTDDGEMICSRELGSAPHELLGIKPGAALRRPPTPQQQAFLQHHRAARKLASKT